MAQGLTRVSQGVQNQDARDSLDRQAGKILEFAFLSDACAKGPGGKFLSGAFPEVSQMENKKGITIPRTFLLQHSTRVSPTWVTNGHWVIAKGILSQREQLVFATLESAAELIRKDISSMTDKDVEIILLQIPERKWTFTGNAEVSLLSGLPVKVEYESNAGKKNEKAYFDLKYLNMLHRSGVHDGGADCTELFGKDPESPFANEARTFVLMPMRGGLKNFA